MGSLEIIASGIGYQFQSFAGEELAKKIAGIVGSRVYGKTSFAGGPNYGKFCHYVDFAGRDGIESLKNAGFEVAIEYPESSPKGADGAIYLNFPAIAGVGFGREAFKIRVVPPAKSKITTADAFCSACRSAGVVVGKESTATVAAALLGVSYGLEETDDARYFANRASPLKAATLIRDAASRLWPTTDWSVDLAED